MLAFMGKWLGEVAERHDASILLGKWGINGLAWVVRLHRTVSRMRRYQRDRDEEPRALSIGQRFAPRHPLQHGALDVGKPRTTRHAEWTQSSLQERPSGWARNDRKRVALWNLLTRRPSCGRVKTARTACLPRLT